MKKKTLTLSLSLLFALTLFSQPAFAETTNPTDHPWERFSLKLGGFVTTLDSNVRIGSQELGAGLDIDLEEATGLESSLSVFRADAFYRFGQTRRHRVDLAYYDFRRDATKVLETDIHFRGETFPVGTRADTFLNLKIIRLAYSYSFFLDDRFDLAFSTGLFMMPLEVGISADGVGDEKEDITAPLPVIGLRGDFAITPKLILTQGFEMFFLRIANFRGGMISTRTAVEYNVWKHVGLGLGYDAFRFAIEAEGEDYPTIDFAGSIKLDYTGLLLYAKFYY